MLPTDAKYPSGSKKFEVLSGGISLDIWSNLQALIRPVNIALVRNTRPQNDVDDDPSLHQSDQSEIYYQS